MHTATMTPATFIAKWKASTLKERSGSQSHFNDLCALLGQPTPTDVDPDGSWYAFERGASILGGGEGWADVWRKKCFAWEYKGKQKNLDTAFKQLQLYAIALENPPLLVVSDMEVIRIHTNFTNTVQEVHLITLDDIAKPETLKMLGWLFTDPERFRPGVTRQAITEQAAEKFAGLAHSLRAKGYEAQRVAHYVNKLMFCMFAEDIEILPKGLFSRLLESGVKNPAQFEAMAKNLFGAMKAGGNFGADAIDWFNGGLFDDDDVLPLEKAELELALRAARLDWSDIEPSVFGTLFERGLDPAKRSQLGAHYTDRNSIMRIVGPVVLDPLRSEWNGIKAQIQPLVEKSRAAKSKGAATVARNEAMSLYEGFRNRLAAVRVLDPACGSGNFLYLALLGLKDLEHLVIFEAESMGLPRAFPSVGPETVMGIELNPYAAELARITIWIGQIQWMLRHGFGLAKNPILQNLNQIECRDALMNQDGTEAVWPVAEFIVGNPPFLGDKKILSELGEEYVKLLRKRYHGLVPGGADLVTYWFEKAREAIEAGRTRSAGFVTTNSIRSGKNRTVLDHIRENGVIFEAWSDEPWVLEGAAVRVSLICFTREHNSHVLLDGNEVREVFSDLTGQGAELAIHADLTQAGTLGENNGVAFQGTIKTGAFNVPGELARTWLRLPTNPNGRPNSDVVKPWSNGKFLTDRSFDTWIVDFGVGMQVNEAELYETPFQYALQNIRDAREGKRESTASEKWWLHQRPRPEFRKALIGRTRYIATVRHSKHRLFFWLDQRVLPDSALVAIARDDDTTFGILHSRYHEQWSLRLCSWIGVGNDPRYSHTTTFGSFPFPEGLTPNIPAGSYAADPRAAKIAIAAQTLIALRDNWLNPPELVKRVPEVVSGFPDRVLPIDEQAATELKKRTLTNLYNQKPRWIVTAHKALDDAVAAAYGWPGDIGDDEALARLLELNFERSTPKGTPQ
jgi:type II restriction/modification system DNA methylase subunit YeeA